jgi:acetyl-CoA C-acetyltransferase
MIHSSAHGGRGAGPGRRDNDGTDHRMTTIEPDTIRDDGVYVLGYARTPFAKFGGSLRAMRLPELGAIPVVEAVRRSGLAPAEIDEVVMGVNFPGQERSVARQVSLRAGVPEDRVAYTVDRACCSSLAAVSLSARALALGEAEAVVAGGVENLSRAPYFLNDTRWGKRLGNITLTDQLVVSCPHTGIPRAIQVAAEAAAFSVGREQQDAWALRSQQRYAKAASTGFFSAEIVPVVTVDQHGHEQTLVDDEVPRPHTSLEGLAALPTVNGSTTVTAGNAPDLSSGASALVLASGRRVRRDGL